jgi:hypothetical protein
MPDLPDFDGRTELTRGTMNALVESARRARATPNATGVKVTDLGSGGRHYDVPRKPEPLRPSVKVLVRNDTGEDAKQGYVFTIKEMIDPDASTDDDEILLGGEDVEVGEEPADDTPAPSTSPGFRGVSPEAGEPFAVLLDALAPGQTGRAIVSGVAVCQVDLVRHTHRKAVPVEGDVTKMVSAESSGAAILWLSDEKVGLRTAVVLIPTGLLVPNTGECELDKCVQVVDDLFLDGFDLYEEVKQFRLAPDGTLQACDCCPGCQDCIPDQPVNDAWTFTVISEHNFFDPFSLCVLCGNWSGTFVVTYACEGGKCLFIQTSPPDPVQFPCITLSGFIDQPAKWVMYFGKLVTNGTIFGSGRINADDKDRWWLLLIEDWPSGTFPTIGRHTNVYQALYHIDNSQSKFELYGVNSLVFSTTGGLGDLGQGACVMSLSAPCPPDFGTTDPTGNIQCLGGGAIFPVGSPRQGCKQADGIPATVCCPAGMMDNLTISLILPTSVTGPACHDIPLPGTIKFDGFGWSGYIPVQVPTGYFPFPPGNVEALAMTGFNLRLRCEGDGTFKLDEFSGYISYPDVENIYTITAYSVSCDPIDIRFRYPGYTCRSRGVGDAIIIITE